MFRKEEFWIYFKGVENSAALIHTGCIFTVLVLARLKQKKKKACKKDITPSIFTWISYLQQVFIRL